jgi:hypothetical protein
MLYLKIKFKTGKKSLRLRNTLALHPNILKNSCNVFLPMNRTDVHDAVIRKSVRALQEIEIPESLHGDVMNACFGFIEKPSVPIATKAFSLTTLFNLSNYYPEIKGELKLVIENN